MDVWCFHEEQNFVKLSTELVPHVHWILDFKSILLLLSKGVRKLVGVAPITTVIRSGRLRWYGHVIKKSDEDWVKKCMEFGVEGRRPVGRPRRTWLESVVVGIAKLQNDREDVHNTKKWRINVMKRKSNLIEKRTINQ